MKEVQREEGQPRKEPQPVVVRPDTRTRWSPIWRPAAIAPFVEMAVSVGLVVALVAFMLARRQDLRNRMLRLIGVSHLTVATQAIDEAFGRISQYLLSLSIVNATLGIAVGIGLSLLGVPYALLWGFLAAVLRFIPYVGVWTAALLPIALGLAVFDGWAKPLLVIALFAVLEPLIFFVMKPLVYRRTVGVSDIALLVAVAVWSWICGPVALILAFALTVCLVVVGRDVPGLEFLAILMGEESAVAPDLMYYQRLLARDQDEANEKSFLPETSRSPSAGRGRGP